MTGHEHQGVGASGLPWRALASARRRAGLSMADLYLRYVALGGTASSALLADHLGAGADVDADQHDLAVLALNERFLELGHDERLPFARAR